MEILLYFARHESAKKFNLYNMLPILISLGILKSPTPESNQFNQMCSLISGLEDYF